jgi:uncharacterized protein
MIQLDLDTCMVLFNRFSGALAVAKKDWLAALGENERSDLLRAKNLVLDSEGESHYRRMIAQSLENYRKDRGLNFYVSPHFDCPMGCQYCFQQNVKTCADHLGLEHIDKIMHFMGEESRRQAIEKVILVLFGGEPLLPQAFNFNEALLKAARKMDYKVRIVTSGTTIAGRYLELLDQHRTTIADIDITIDGPEDVHNQLRPLRRGAGSFEIIEKNVSALLRSGLPVSAKTNVGKDNIGHIEALFETFSRLRWTEFPHFRILMNFVRDFGGIEVREQRLSESDAVIRLTSVLNELPPEIRGKTRIDSVKLLGYLAHCFLSKSFYSGEPRAAFCNPDSRTTYSIGPDCNIYSCNWMVGKQEFVDGTIFQGKKRGPSGLPNPCETCSISTLCGGGCLIERRQEDYFKKCYPDNIRTLREFACQTAPKIDNAQLMVISGEFKWLTSALDHSS